MPRNHLPLSRIDVTAQEYADLAGNYNPAIAYYVDGVLKSIGGQAVGSGGGTNFTFDAVAQAARAVVDGVEVLAPKRVGNGIQANVNVRSSILADLLGLDGGPSELSAPSDMPGLVRHTGVAGGAQWISPFGSIYSSVSDADQINLNIPARHRLMYFGVISVVRNVGLTIGNGYVVGQIVTVVAGALGSIGPSLNLSPMGININPLVGEAFDLIWDGTAWTVARRYAVQSIAADKSGSSINGGTATGTGSLALGTGATALGKFSTALSPSSSDFVGSVAVQSLTPGEFAYAFGNNNQSCRKSVALLARTTIAANTATELTSDGAAATDANRYRFPAAAVTSLGASSAMYVVRLVVMGFNSTTTKAVKITREAVVWVNSASGIVVMNQPAAADTDYTLAMSVPTLALGASGTDAWCLTVSLTTPDTAVRWRAAIETIRLPY